jgi:para-aminobenzoate synthetase component 1
MDQLNIWNDLLQKSEAFPYSVLFVSQPTQNPRPLAYHQFDWMFLAGSKVIDQISDLKSMETSSQWHFGHLNYDLKNELHQLKTKFKPVDYPNLGMVEAEWVVQSKNGVISTLFGLEYSLPTGSWDLFPTHSPQSVHLSPLISEEMYLDDLKKVRDYLKNGACYELNYCFPFVGKVTEQFNPNSFFLALMQASPMPFSVLYKTPEIWAMSASPERYLKKQNNKLISQPIKGTRKRSKENDAAFIDELMQSEKENAEHIMIVDLVRNDLAQCCKIGSVAVPELKQVYTFERVHQMISTVTAELSDHHCGIDALIGAFPMGSMTGAPKKRVMEIIDELEHAPRGLYSGSIGYFTPDGDFDFNVVIRTLVVETKNKIAQMGVGGAITYLSNPQDEYEECWVKAAPILGLSTLM